jgi:hypothetical protein
MNALPLCPSCFLRVLCAPVLQTTISKKSFPLSVCLAPKKTNFPVPSSNTSSMKKLLFLLLFPLQIFAQPSSAEITRWEKQAKQVTIIRDNYGVPHIYGKTDADAVFGLMYAQCEDDFKRVEMNYLEKL